MKVDIHVHIADVEALLAARNNGSSARSNVYLTRVLRSAFAGHSAAASGGSVNEQWARCLAGWVKESPLDKVVLLALDAAYDESGQLRPEHTILHVDNDFVCSVAAQYAEFIFGASIHPYRKDAVNELERLVQKGARLIKWIPSGQHIEPDHPKCFPFYEALAHYRLPLLTHTGVEHTLGCRRSSFNHPQRLVPALEKGVTVIAAHCGEHLFLHEPSFFKSWAALARRYENLYGDSGAFSIVTRVPCLRRILRDSVLQTKLLYGSDFPGIPSPLWCWQLGLGKMRETAKIKNPIARNVSVMQALEMPPEMFERAPKRLGITKGAAADER